MKNSVLIISAISVLALAACSDNQKQKSNGENEAQNADTVAMAASSEPAGNEELVEVEEDEFAGIPDDFIYFVNKLPQSPEKTFYHQSDKEKCGEYCSIDEYFYAYPIKNGGYLTVFECVRIEKGYLYRWYGVYCFKNGKLYRSNNALPVPKLDDWIDQSKCEGREDVEALTEVYSNGIFKYDINKDNGDVTPTIEHHFYEEDIFAADLLKKIVFTWNGEIFVPKEVTEGIAMRFWRKILQGYDPIGRLEGDEEPSDEMIAGNLKRIKEESDNVADYVAKGVDGFTETAACYPKTDGSWLVIFYLASNNSPDHSLRVYDFDGTNITRRDNYFPNDFLTGDWYLMSPYSFRGNVLSVFRDIAEDEDRAGRDPYADIEFVDYKWNGECFVK